MGIICGKLKKVVDSPFDKKNPYTHTCTDVAVGILVRNLSAASPSPVSFSPRTIMVGTRTEENWDSDTELTTTGATGTKPQKLSVSYGEKQFFCLF